jgi:hypothetical protein
MRPICTEGKRTMKRAQVLCPPSPSSAWHEAFTGAQAWVRRVQRVPTFGTTWCVYGVVSLLLLLGVQARPREASAAMAALASQESGALQPLVMTAELGVGQNRLAFGLLKAHQLLDDARVVVRLYALAGADAHLVAEVPAPYQALEIVAQGAPVHHHPDGTRHVHYEEETVRGIYVAQVTFARPGPWGLEVRAQHGEGPLETARVTVMVVETPATPARGAAAPPSRNLIASDVQDLRQIDTSQPPDPRLHQVRIADAIAQGRPQVIVFATPQFCTSRMCGPIVEVVRSLLPAYGERVVFTHQEIWQDAVARHPFATVEEWRLPSEPWLFVVDGQGIIQAKFEGLVTVREVDTVLQQIVSPHTPPRPEGRVSPRGD